MVEFNGQGLTGAGTAGVGFEAQRLDPGNIAGQGAPAIGKQGSGENGVASVGIGEINGNLRPVRPVFTDFRKNALNQFRSPAGFRSRLPSGGDQALRCRGGLLHCNAIGHGQGCPGKIRLHLGKHLKPHSSAYCISEGEDEHGKGNGGGDIAKGKDAREKRGVDGAHPVEKTGAEALLGSMQPGVAASPCLVR